MGIISDWITSKTQWIDNAVDDAAKVGSSWLGKAREYEDFGREMHRSWIWDNREAISGEAKTFHPFQFADFTPLRWIGVTRLPQTAARGIEAGVKGAKSLSKQVNKAKAWSTTKTQQQQRRLPNLRRNLRPLKTAIPAAKNLLAKTSKGTKKGASWIKKNPKKTAATIGGALIASGIHNRQRDSTEEEMASWIRKRKVSRAKWVT